MNEHLKQFDRLIEIMNDLREQCPWDKKQTIHTLRTLTIEETYELADAILQNDWNNLKEELGDLFLHLVFYSKIAQENGQFDVSDVLHTVCEKLIARHPHIYGNVQVKDEEDVKKNWELLKLKEGKKSILQGVPNALPPINKALRIQDKAKNVGFEWETKQQVWDKVLEEMEELKIAEQHNDINKIEEEFGDLIFSLINYARFLKIDTEIALERTNQKFMNRFNKMEKYLNEKNIGMSDLPLEKLDELWNLAKSNQI